MFGHGGSEWLLLLALRPQAAVVPPWHIDSSCLSSDLIGRTRSASASVITLTLSCFKVYVRASTLGPEASLYLTLASPSPDRYAD